MQRVKRFRFDYIGRKWSVISKNRSPAATMSGKKPTKTCFERFCVSVVDVVDSAETSHWPWPVFQCHAKPVKCLAPRMIHVMYLIRDSALRT